MDHVLDWDWDWDCEEEVVSVPDVVEWRCAPSMVGVSGVEEDLGFDLVLAWNCFK